jgi:acetyltransferase-like isoleucine patch superfamily enzyme
MDTQIHNNISQPAKASWRQYALLAVGSESLWDLIKYEILTGLLSGFPGGLGLWLRRKLYPTLLGSCGKGLIIGRNVTLRGTGKIHLGDHVALDDGVVIDARGPDAEVRLGDDALASRNVIFRARNGRIRLGNHANIGVSCLLATNSTLEVGDDTLVAAFCYLIAGGNHGYQDPDIPIRLQGFENRGGIRIGNDVWIGSHVAVQDGVTIQNRAVIGCHAMVNKDIPELGVAWGIPAMVHRKRGEKP